MLRLIQSTSTAVVLAALCALASAAHAGEAGKVVFVTGQVTLAARPAELNQPVQEGDEMSTGADGYIYVKTIDSGFLVLRPNSKARIAAYHVDEKNPANTHVKLELLNGVARSISGQGVKQARQNFRFNTPVAAIGVRGTDFVVYTDQQVSRVAVMSGGIVVSGFSGGCGPEGSGPCEGGSSRELFAGQAGLMLQVQRGQPSPQLLRSPVLSPEQQGAPARPDEPVGKVGASAVPVAEINLDAQKANNALNGKQITKTEVTSPTDTTTTTPPLVVVDPIKPPPVKPVEPPVRSAPEVVWGRYEAIAGGFADAELKEKLAGGTYGAPQFLGSYQIARLNSSTLILPKEGSASFTLTGSDALLQKTGQEAIAATVENAHLDVNFASRTFSTGLTVVGGDMRVPVNINGNVTTKGELVNSSIITDSRIKGYLGGANVEEAAYLFQVKTYSATVNGATKWSR